MPDTIKIKSSHIRVIAEWLAEKGAAYCDATKLAPEKADEKAVETMTSLAALTGERTELGQDDIFYAWTMNRGVEHDKAFRTALDLPEENPAGIVRTEPLIGRLPGGGQLAMLKITPEKIDADKNPVIFFGGLFHKHSTYYTFIAELAKEEGRVILMVDSPGVGSSSLPHGTTIRAEHFEKALDVALAWVGKIGQELRVDLMGHSLGTVAVRAGMVQEEALAKKGVIIDRFVPIAPMPSEHEKTCGYDFSTTFTLSGLGSVVANGFKMMRPQNTDNFFGNLKGEERQWLDRQVKKERFPASPVSFFNIFWGIDQQSFLDHLAKGSGKVSLVMAAGDQLMQLRERGGWEDKKGNPLKGIYILDSAPHSFLSFKTFTPERRHWLNMVRYALNENHPRKECPVEVDKDTINLTHAAFNKQFRGRTQLFVDSIGLEGVRIGLGLEMMMRQGLFPLTYLIGKMGVRGGGCISCDAGAGFLEGDVTLGVGIKPEDIALRFELLASLLPFAQGKAFEPQFDTQYALSLAFMFNGIEISLYSGIRPDIDDYKKDTVFSRKNAVIGGGLTLEW